MRAQGKKRHLVQFVNRIYFKTGLNQLYDPRCPGCPEGGYGNVNDEDRVPALFPGLVDNIPH